MFFSFFRSKRQKMLDLLFDAERHPQPPVVANESELILLLSVDSTTPIPSAEVEHNIRRSLAMLHYGNEDEDIAGRELLTQGERDYLDAYLLSERWAAFRCQQLQSGWQPHH